jgi:hypothetical protein
MKQLPEFDGTLFILTDSSDPEAWRAFLDGDHGGG